MGAGLRAPRATQIVSYTSSKLQPPPGASSSEDELCSGEPQSRPMKLRDGMLATAGPTKRRAEGSPDVLHGDNSAKRRTNQASEADISRTKFAQKPADRRKGPITLRVVAAVCEPGLIYPAPKNMQQNADGASDETCNLLSKSDSLYGFMPTKDLVNSLAALEWMVPKVLTIEKLWHANDSAIVKVKKTIDLAQTISTGRILFLQFTTSEEAKDCVSYYRTTFSVKCDILPR